MKPLEFVNDVLKPYDELNSLLVKRLAFEPELSDVTRLARAVATAIRHLPEKTGFKQQQVIKESLSHRLVSDVSDAWKHVRLGDDRRNNEIFVTAMFEYDEVSGFRFLRNSLSVKHATLKEHDFLEATLDAIRYWRQKIPLEVTWKNEGRIRTAPKKFYETAYLYYDSKYCVSMKNTRFRFYKQNFRGKFSAIDPKEARIEIFQKGHVAPKASAIIRRDEVLKNRAAGIKTWKPKK